LPTEIFNPPPVNVAMRHKEPCHPKPRSYNERTNR
jgi:hypothetical protein